jgi:hypothetical protein
MTTALEVEKQISADDKALAEARYRRQKVLEICRTYGGVGTFASGSVATGVVNDPVEDADGGMTLDRRRFPKLGPDGGGETPSSLAAMTFRSVRVWPMRRTARRITGQGSVNSLTCSSRSGTRRWASAKMR